MFGRRAASLLVIFVVPVTALGACGIRTPLDLYYPPEDSGLHVVGAVDAAHVVDAGSPVDARDGGVGPEDAAPDVALPLVDLGNVLLTSGSYVDKQTLVATASFFPTVNGTGCAIVEVAPGCTLETCEAPTNAQLASAGDILASGGIYPLPFQQSSTNLYTAPSSLFEDGGVVALWSGGETIVVNASGDIVPSFVATFTAPTQVTVLTPFPASLALSTPLAFSWTGASAGKVAVDISVDTGTADRYLECRFDVGAGAGTVPVEALGTLGASGSDVALTVSTLVETDGNVGAWTLQVFAQTDANDQAGREYTGVVGAR